MPLDQIEHGRMIQVRFHDALKRAMYLGEQPSDSVTWFE